MKKTIAILLTLCMLVGMVPITVSAAGSLSGDCTDLFQNGVPDGFSVSIANDASKPWEQDEYGTYKSTMHDDSSSAAITVDITVPDDGKTYILNYDYCCSSEANYDKLIVDTSEFSGDTGWCSSFAVLTSGANTVSFSYEKDDSSSDGTDEVWVGNFKCCQVLSGVTLSYTHGGKTDSISEFGQTLIMPTGAVEAMSISYPSDGYTYVLSVDGEVVESLDEIDYDSYHFILLTRYNGDVADVYWLMYYETGNYVPPVDYPWLSMDGYYYNLPVTVTNGWGVGEDGLLEALPENGNTQELSLSYITDRSTALYFEGLLDGSGKLEVYDGEELLAECQKATADWEPFSILLDSGIHDLVLRYVPGEDDLSEDGDGLWLQHFTLSEEVLGCYYTVICENCEVTAEDYVYDYETEESFYLNHRTVKSGVKYSGKNGDYIILTAAAKPGCVFEGWYYFDEYGNECFYDPSLYGEDDPAEYGESLDFPCNDTLIARATAPTLTEIPGYSVDGLKFENVSFDFVDNMFPWTVENSMLYSGKKETINHEDYLSILKVTALETGVAQLKFKGSIEGYWLAYGDVPLMYDDYDSDGYYGEAVTWATSYNGDQTQPINLTKGQSVFLSFMASDTQNSSLEQHIYFTFDASDGDKALTIDFDSAHGSVTNFGTAVTSGTTMENMSGDFTFQLVATPTDENNYPFIGWFNKDTGEMLGGREKLNFKITDFTSGNALTVEARFAPHTLKDVQGYSLPNGISAVQTYERFPWSANACVVINNPLQDDIGAISQLVVTAGMDGIMKVNYSAASDNNSRLYYGVNCGCYMASDPTSLYRDAALTEICENGIPTEAALAEIPVSAGDKVSIILNEQWEANAPVTLQFSMDDTSYSISAAVNDAGCGSVSGVPAGGTAAIGANITLTATPNSGYDFLYWHEVGSSTILSRNPEYKLSLMSNRNVVAEFVPVGTYVAFGQQTNQFYSTFDAAFADNTTVFTFGNVTLSDNYTVPAGKTLIVSCMDNDPGVVKGRNPDGTNTAGTVGVGPDAKLYSTLTVPEGKTLTVNGTLIVNAVTGRPEAGHYDQDITGGYAKIALDGNIVVNGTLKNYGYIEGTGSVTANAGGTVGDLYIATNWRGGTQALAMYNNSVYPMNEYAIHNITVPVIINSGAAYTALVKMYASGSYNYTEFPQVGANALIQPVSGTTVTKTFEGVREKYTINGSANFGSSTLSIVGTNLSTGDFLYPWDGDMDFEIVSGTTTFDNNFKFMPGAVVNVGDNANITVASGKSVVFYDDGVFNDVDNTDNTQYPEGRGNAKLNIGKNVTVTNNGTLVGEMNFPDDVGTGTVTGSNWTATTNEANGYNNGVKPYTFTTTYNRTNYSGEIKDDTLVWTANEATIIFNTNGGSSVDPLTAAVGAQIYAPDAPTKAGYVFGGWYEDNETFAVEYTFTTMSKNKTLYAKWTPATDTAYKVEHYQQNISDDGYTLADTENLTGTTLQTVTATAKSYTGFTYDDSVSATVKEGAIAADGTLVLKLYYTRNSYTLTWDVNGGSAITSTGHTTGSVKYGTAITKPANDPTKTGYTFAGWQSYTDSMTMPAADTTMTAQWTAKKFTVTLNANGGTCATTSKEVTYDSTYGDLPTPTRTGYKFEGWFDGQNEVKSTDTVAITTAQTLTAQWTANTYTVTFNSDGGSACDPITVTYGQAYGNLPTPTKEGYSFGGWYDGDNKVENTTTYQTESNTELKAKWVVLAFTITYYVDGAKVTTQYYNFGDTITLYNYVKDGYTISEWTLLPSGSLPEKMPAKGLTVSATTTPTVYNITYNLNDGTNAEGNPETYTVETDTFSLSEPAKTGYTFSGWTTPTNSTPTKSVTVTKGSIGDLTYTANWQVNSHKVTYTVDGADKYSENANYGAEVTLKADETKTGYTFSGWNVTGATAVEDKFTMPDNDVTISGTFAANTYTVKFDVNGGDGEMADQSFTYDAEQALTANTFTKTGYTFSGWKNGNTTYADKENVKNLTAEANGVVTLVAQWNVNQYTITFDLNGVPAASIDPITADYGTEVNVPADPECEGYIFNEWDKVVPTTMPDEDITITAHWTSYVDLFGDLKNFEGDNLATAREYYSKMNEDQQGELNTEEFFGAIKDYSTEALEKAVEEAVAPTNELLKDNEQKEIAVLSLNEKSVDVRLVQEDFLASDMLTVDFLAELFGYEGIESVDVGEHKGVGVNQRALMLAVAEEAGVDLAEATTEKISVLDGKVMEATLNGKTAEGVEYSATYTLTFFNNTHAVTWDADGGELSGEYTSGSTAFGTAITAPTATKTGYTFTGWDEAVPATMPAEDITLTAQWTINKYTITFKDGDETLDTITQDYGTTVESPEDPTKTGYTFTGWDKAVPTTMPAEDITLTAQWTVNEYTITFKDGDETLDTIKQDYGTAVKAPEAPTKTGYTFEGWNEAVPATMPAEDITLTAQWTIAEYKVTTENTTVYEDDDDSIERTAVKYTQDFEARTVTFTVNETDDGKNYNWIVYVDRGDGKNEIVTAEEGVYTVSEVYSDITVKVVSVLIGDMNLDGAVNSKDATRLAKHLAEITTVTDEISLIAADCNLDGAVNSKDATRLAKYLVQTADLSREQK